MALLKANTGIGTTNPTSALHVIGDGLVTGVVTATTFNGQINAGISTLGVTTVTRLTAQSINSSGIVTGLSFRPSSGYYQSANGTNAFYVYDGTGNVAFQGTIGASQVNNASGFKVIGFAGTDITFESNAYVAGVTTSAGGFVGNLTGTATTATKLETPRTFEITGDIAASPVSFDGTGNVSLAATIQPNSVGLGTDTFGDYVRSISGTSDQITVTGGTGEGSTPTISLPNNLVIPEDAVVTRDLQVNRNLNVTGNITIGGTTAFVNVQELVVTDPDIILGYRTDAFGNDVSNDNTANHGGVAVASTEGTPLVDLFIAGIETAPATYKKIMWFKEGTFAGLGTDAWLFNYAVGIGSTQFPNGTRLAAGNVQFTQNDLAVVRNINASGIVTASSGFVGNLTGTASTAAFATTAFNLSDAANITTGTINTARLTGTYNIDISGNAATATNAGVATYAVSAGIATYANVAGVATYANVAGVATYAVSAGVATYANVAGVATYAVSAGVATYANVAGVATYASVSGIATYADNAGIATYATVAGIASYASFAGKATYADNAGISTYATVAGIATYASSSGIATYATSAGIATYANVAGIATYATSSGIATYADNAGIATYATLAGVATYATSAGIATYATLAGIATYATNAGISTYATSSGIATYATSSGIATYADNAGIATYATSSGIATYADNAGVSTSVIGGIASVTQLNVSGVSTFDTIQISSGIITATSGIITYYGDGSKLQNLVAVAGIAIQDEGSIVGTSVTTLNFSGLTISASNAVNGITTVTVTESGIAGYANSAGISTNLKGGVTGNVPYQSAPDTTTFVTNGISGQVLLFNGSVPIWGNVSAASGAFGGITVYDEGNLVGTANSISSLNFVSPNLSIQATSGANGIATITLLDYVSNAGVATYATSAGIATYATSSGIATYANVAGIATYANVTGIATYATVAGIATYATTAGVATALQTPRTFEITGDVVASAISFDGTGNVSLAATIQPNSVGLGTDTFGDYVQSISGTSNQITVTSGTGEGSTPTISLPNNLVVPQDLTVTRDLQVNRNLNVTGSVTIGGTSAFINVPTLTVFDPDIILGYRTDAFGNDVSNDNTANHGGVAIASTEGSPLVQLFIAGIETNPATYKKIMWFKAGTFAGLGTDAWLSNYAVGIGSTQFPTGTRLAAGSVQFTENDLAVVRNINASGILTAGIATLSQLWVSGVSTFVGVTTNTSTLFANQLSVSGVATFAGITTVTGTTLFARQLNVSGVSTIGNFRITPVGTGATVGGIGVTYYGDGSQLSNIVTGVSISTNTTNSNQFIPYAVSAGSTTGFGVTTLLVYNPSTDNLGIGTTNPLQTLHIQGNLLVAAGAATTQHITQKAYELQGGALSWEGSAGQLFSITNNLTSGSIFSVNDVSGIPSIDVNADGTVTLAPYADGNVGIATTLPTSRLHVVGNALIAGIATVTSNFIVNGNSLVVDATNNRIGIGTTNPIHSLQVGTANTLGISTDGQIFVITSTEDVGIGTTRPTSKLHVVGGALITGVSTVGNFRMTPVGTGATVGGIGVTYFGDGSQLTGIAATDNVRTNSLVVTGVSTLGITSISQLNVTGVSTFAGITTVTGPTLFARQLNVSGVITAVQFIGSASTASFATTAFNVIGSASTASFANTAFNVNGTANRVLYNSATNTTSTSSNLTFDGTTLGVGVTITANRYGITSGTILRSGNITGITTGTGDSFNHVYGTNSLLISNGGGGSFARSYQYNNVFGSNLGDNLLWSGGGLNQYWSYNNVIGHQSLRNFNFNSGSVSGGRVGYNNIIGFQIAGINTGGDTNFEYNNIIGYQAGYTLGGSTATGNNIFGYQAGYNLTSGSYNVFTGYLAGYSNATGSYNIGIGYSAGQAKLTGSNNIVIGYNRDVPTAGGNTQLVIGSNTDDWIVGNSSYNVGIGTNAPTSKLHVNGGIGATTLNVTGVSTFAGIATHTAGLFGTTASFTGIVTASSYRGDGSQLTGIAAGFSISTNTTNSNQYIPYATSFGSTTGFGATTLLVYNPSTTRLGIGTTSPQYNLHVIGDFAATSKSFVIDHPTKSGKKLRYASLEGPEQGVYVRGRSQETIIELPEYWTALVDENSITVNLTPIGHSAMPRVESINQNIVNVFSKEDGDLDYYYTIYAERKDIEKLVVEY